MRFTKAFFLSILSLWGTSPAFARTAPADAVIQALDEAIQDEFRARATYQKVISDFGRVLPFANIVEAEARHIEELSGLYAARGLKSPKSLWNEANVPSFETIGSACRAGVQGEIENIAIYDRLMKLRLPSDVERTFGYLREASLERHLPAFKRCAE